MSQSTAPAADTTALANYYRSAPYGAVGTLDDQLVHFTARSATTIGGDGVVDFYARLGCLLSEGEAVTLDDLAQRLSVAPEALLPVLERLVGAGVLRSSTAAHPPPVLVAALRAGDQVSEGVIADRIATTNVSLIGRPDSHLARAVAQATNELGLRVSTTDSLEETAPDLRVVFGSSHLDQLLLDANARALQDHTPWLPVIPYDGETAWVGPFSIPWQSACLRCFTLRRSANFSDDVFRPELLRVESASSARPELGPNPVHRIQAGVVANLLLERVALRDHAPSAAPGGLTTISVNDAGLDVQTRRVLRVPRCPACSPSADTGFPQVWFHAEAVGRDSGSMGGGA